MGHQIAYFEFKRSGGRDFIGLLNICANHLIGGEGTSSLNGIAHLLGDC